VNRNPARPAEILGKTTRSNPVDVERAIESAHKTQREWSARSRAARGAVLEKAANLLRNKGESLAKSITQEQGKSLAEARGEVAMAFTALRAAAAEALRPSGELLSAETSFACTSRAPLGVVAVISSWVSPFGTPAAWISSALLEGNAVVFKPSSLTPGIAGMLTRLFEEAGAPSGTLNLVYGPGAALSAALLGDARVRGVAFAGSAAHLREIGQAVSRRGVRLVAESSGGNPTVVLAGCDLELAARTAAQAAFTSAAHRADRVTRVLVESSVQERFTQALVTRARELRAGDALTQPHAVPPLADEKRLAEALEAIDAARKDGAELLCGGERISDASAGHFLAPTVLRGVPATAKLLGDEFFGPALCVQPFDGGLDAARELVEGAARPTACWIFTAPGTESPRVAERFGSAIVHVNSAVAGEVPVPLAGSAAFFDWKRVTLG
jgi:aldehyde dehydrogenase (NAD+)